MGEVFTLGNQKAPGSESTDNSRTDRLIQWTEEIAACFIKMKEFEFLDAAEVFLALSQFSARASEMRFQLGGYETRKEASFRTRIIDPFLEECDRQFKFHSRATAVAEVEARLAGGKFT